MNAGVDDADVARFREIVAALLGLGLEDVPIGFLRAVLHRRWTRYGGSCATYLDRLSAGSQREETAAVAEELTISETYFFRNIEQFRAFADVVLPERMRARATDRRLQVLSAGCASGEEPYTIAMVVRDAVRDPSWEVSVTGIDINRTMLRRAEAARYLPWALRATPADARRRWFRVDGAEAVLDEGIRRSVRFVQGNLADDEHGLWQPEQYDAIFCRNVLMYLTPHAARALMDRLMRALAPGGFLFLGHAETARYGSLDVRHTHDTFYYQRPVGVAGPGRHGDGEATGGPWDWQAVIGQAYGRIRTLTAARPARVRSATSTLARPGASDWDLALDLLRDERFGEALEAVEAFPAALRNRPDALILQAVLLAQSGQLDAAEAVCRRLLDSDGLDAGAHYLLAVCLESGGDLRAAGNHHQAAAYHDPSFAMPRLRLGLLARRRGDRGAARRELGRALALLTREDAHRLLLFGGGFSREALLTLCRAELVAAGGTP